MSRLSNAGSLLWCAIGLWQVFSGSDNLFQRLTTTEKIVLPLFLVFCYRTFWGIAAAAGGLVLLPAGKRIRDTAKAAAPFFFLVLFEGYWYVRTVLPEEPLFSPGKLLKIALIGLAALLVAFGIAKYTARVNITTENGGRKGLRLNHLFYAAAAVLFYMIYVSGGWLYHPFERPAAAPTSEKPPNLVMVTLDTMGANYTALHGYPLNNTPGLEALAEEGIVFEQMITPVPITGPAHATIMTGLIPRVHRMFNNGQPLDDRFTTLAEVLQDNGYHGAQFTNIFVCGARVGMNQGFDVSFLRQSSESAIQKMLVKATVFSIGTRAWDIFQTRRFKHNPHEENYFVVREWLEKKRREPFFLWFHTYIPHTPYDPPADIRKNLNLSGVPLFDSDDAHEIYENKTELDEARVAEIRRMYLGDIMQADRVLSKLLKDLDDSGLSDNTIVIVTSDHGETIYERDHFIGHTRQVNYSTARVPFVMRLPGKQWAGTRIDTITSLADIMPSLLDFLDIDYKGHMNGTSLMPLVKGVHNGDVSTGLPRRGMVVETFPPEGETHKISALYAGRQYIVDLSSSKEQLYDYTRDPFEKDNLIHREPEDSESLSGLLEILRSYEKEYPFRGTGNMELDEKTRKELKDLGYIH